MNALSDRDLELLERYLDGELVGVEAEEVRRRLSAGDAQWEGALEGLREQRLTRMRVWEALEGDRASGQQFADQVMAQARRQEMRRRFFRAARGPAAAAACIAFFVAGWFARGQAVAGSPSKGGAVPGLVANGVTGTQAGREGAQVVLTDEDNNVVAVQPFDGIDQARQFAEDLGLWRAKHQQAKKGRLIRVSDEF